MAQNDILKRYLDAGIAFTTLTQSRAEALVKDLVKAGEVQADQAREAVTELVERSRKNTEKLLDTVRDEVRNQITGLGLVKKDDLDKLEARLSRFFSNASRATSSAAKKAPARKAPAKKAASAAKATKKAATKKAGTAKKAATRRAPAKKRA
jgi:polyhydroxyalkanoate synthesis regulator phasin